VRAADAGAALESIAGDAVRVTVDGAPSWLLRRDLASLERSVLDTDAVTLLPLFDTLMLAHATKEHLVERRWNARVYRPQGWISPVVLQGGRVVAVWFSKPRGTAVEGDVQPIARHDRSRRERIAVGVG